MSMIPKDFSSFILLFSFEYFQIFDSLRKNIVTQSEIEGRVIFKKSNKVNLESCFNQFITAVDYLMQLSRTVKNLRINSTPSCV